MSSAGECGVAGTQEIRAVELLFAGYGLGVCAHLPKCAEGRSILLPSTTARTATRRTSGRRWAGAPAFRALRGFSGSIAGIGGPGYFTLHRSIRKACPFVEAIRSRPPHVNVIATGRYAPQSLVEVADMVTEMVKVRHPLDRGIYARAGLDF